MLLNKKKIQDAILEIKQLQIKYCKADTTIVYRALDKALNKLGWDLAILSSNSKGAGDENPEKMERHY